MKQFFLKTLLLASPTLVTILLPQTSTVNRYLFAPIFILISLILLIVGSIKSGSAYKMISESYSKGMAIMAIFLLVCSFYPVGGLLSQPLMLPHSDQNADAIVVLASGATPTGEPGLSGYQRTLHGIKLLKDNRAPKLFISTGYSKVHGYAESGWVASMTRLTEIPAAKLKIMINERIRTTATEADYIAEVLKKEGKKSILLVTSSAHLYRAKACFEKHDISVLPAPAHTPQNVYYASDHYLGSFNSVMHEWIGLLYYRLRNYI